MGTLSGKVAIVLGAGTPGNMGHVIAQKFAAEGARVMVGGRNESHLAQLSETIGGKYTVCDITREEDLARLVGATLREFNGLNVAVNTVGHNLFRGLLKTSRADLMAVTEVQFIGVFLFMQAVLRGMQDGGSIIQISSVSATAMLPDHAAYMATKAAGECLVRSIASEFGSRGIKINSIAPGATLDTPMAAELLSKPGVVERISRTTPLGRIGIAEDVANAAVWLASDKSFITGECLQINGGRALNFSQKVFGEGASTSVIR